MDKSETRKMVAGLYISRHPADGRFIKTIELPHELGTHHRDKKFKQCIRELVAAEGFIVETVNVLVTPARGVDVTVGVREKKDGMLAARRRPVSINGAPLGPSRGDRKTLAQRQREQRRKRPV